MAPQSVRTSAADLMRAHLQLGRYAAAAGVDELADLRVAGALIMELLEAASALVRGFVVSGEEHDGRDLTRHQRELEVLQTVWDAIERGDVLGELSTNRRY